MESNQTSLEPEHVDCRPNKDEINFMYSPCPRSAYFDLLDSAYTGNLDRFMSPRSAYFDLLDSAYTGNLDRFMMLVSSYVGNGLIIQWLVDEDGTGSLAYAAAGGRVDVCRYLLEELNLYVDVKDNHGLTPLCYGAVKGHLDTVEYLLEQGANPDGSNDPNSTTNTPLHYAILGGNRKIQTLLLSKDIHINAVTRSGTALSYAAALDQLDAVKVLLDHHADPNVKLMGSVTPLASTILTNSPEIMDLLLQAGADPNGKSCGIAPLVYGVTYGPTQFIVRLLEAGADPNVTDNEGMTAVEHAAKEGKHEIVEILFPVTSCIPTYPNWTIGGLMEHVHSEAAKKKKVTDTTEVSREYPLGLLQTPATLGKACGTMIVGLNTVDGIVMTADSRIMFMLWAPTRYYFCREKDTNDGTYKEARFQKICCSHNCLLALTGETRIGKHMYALMEKTLPNYPLRIEELLSKLELCMRKLKDEYGKRRVEDIRGIAGYFDEVTDPAKPVSYLFGLNFGTCTFTEHCETYIMSGLYCNETGKYADGIFKPPMDNDKAKEIGKNIIEFGAGIASDQQKRNKVGDDATVAGKVYGATLTLAEGGNIENLGFIEERYEKEEFYPTPLRRHSF